MARIALLVLGLSASAVANELFTQDQRNIVMSDLRTMGNFFNGKVDGHVNRRAECDEEAYFNSIPRSNVDEKAFLDFLTKCTSFLETAFDTYYNNSHCQNECMAPAIQASEFLASGTTSGCDELKNGFKMARAIFTDVTCTKTAAGKSCGMIVKHIVDGDFNLDNATASAKCNYFNDAGCCYERVVQMLKEQPLTKDTVKNFTIANDTKTIRADCLAQNASNTAVFAAACTVASTANGQIKTSSISSGVSSAHALGVPSVLALVMPIFVAMCTMW